MIELGMGEKNAGIKLMGPGRATSARESAGKYMQLGHDQDEKTNSRRRT